MTDSFHCHLNGVELCDRCTGQHLVTTTSGSIYHLDLDARVVTRVPDPERVDAWLTAGNRRPAPDEVVLWRNPTGEAGESGQSSALRRDGEPVRLVQLTAVQLGRRTVLTLDLLENGLLTVRHTTAVTRVEKLET